MATRSSFPQLAFILLGLHHSASAYTTFETNCTIPKNEVNFVTSPNSRGTLDILWASLLTILACTWTIQHLNVPKQRLERDPGWRGDIKWKAKGSWTTTKWMLGTMIAPEIVLVKAVIEFVAAKKITKRMKAFANEDDVPWTRTHAMLAIMGGFVIEYGGRPEQGPETQRETQQSESDPTESREENLEALEGNLPSNINPLNEHKINQNSTEQSSDEDHKKWEAVMQERKSYRNVVHLTANEIHSLRDAHILKKLPFCTDDDIYDKSKSDAFTKAIAFGQILWFTIQIIVRASRRIPVSQLELTATAFSACGLVIYIFNWKKPQSVRVPYVILQYESVVPRDALQKLGVSHGTLSWVLLRNTHKYDLEQRLSGSPIPNDFTGAHGSEDNSDAYGLLLGTTVFGALHVVAWNFDFPTHAEQIVWRVTSIYIATALFILLAVGIFMELIRILVSGIFPSHESKSGKNRDNYIYLVFAIIYVLSRLFLLVEIFRSLCFLPPDAYISTWTANIPHLG
ncbi:hypothetical protein MMC20_003516 [Loxospora ochrophaea]|nr:hypothetical protein [Loxospora ochrophaea]